MKQGQSAEVSRVGNDVGTWEPPMRRGAIRRDGSDPVMENGRPQDGSVELVDWMWQRPTIM